MAEQNYTEEIDLNYLFRKSNNFFKKSVRAIFLIFNFFLKYWIVTLLLLIIGIGYGFYKDSISSKVYKNEGIIIPNFESVDYLYGTIEELNKRIHLSDTLYLKEIIGNNYHSLKKIEIEPISDIYNMMTKSREQIDVFRIIYQNQEFDKFVENISTSKYFKFHKITFTIKGENRSKEIIKNIFSYWNNNSHFKEYEKIYSENAVFQVYEYKNMISQVDSIIKAISSASNNNQSSGVVISDNTNLHLLLQQKREMLNELLQAEIRLNDYTEPIKLVNMDYEVQAVGISNIIKYPLLLLFLFSLIFFIRFLLFRMRAIAYQ